MMQRTVQIWTCCGHLVVHDRAEAPDVRTLRKASSDDIEQFRNVLDAKADDYGLRTGMTLLAGKADDDELRAVKDILSGKVSVEIGLLHDALGCKAKVDGLNFLKTALASKASPEGLSAPREAQEAKARQAAGAVLRCHRNLCRQVKSCQAKAKQENAAQRDCPEARALLLGIALKPGP